MSQMNNPVLTLLVETPKGVFLRPIAHALPLPPGANQGSASEEAVDACAAVWGLPDFVYRPVVQRVASGNREVGDRILLVGATGVVVQVKRRAAAGSQKSREEAWIRKSVAKARRQGQGTIRSLSSRHIWLVNGRGREVTLQPEDLSWLVAVVIDHEDPPDGILFEGSGTFSEIVLLRRDWEFLFDQLRSTHAVVEYLKRAAASESIALGREPIRYYEFAAADAATPPTPLDPRISEGGRAISAPLLPQEPAGAEAHGYHKLLRVILEDLATCPMSQSVSENDRLAVLAEIDRLPVAHRAELGELLLSMMRDVASSPSDETKWRFRRFRFPPPEPQLAFGACSRFSELHFEAFRQWVALRHHEYGTCLGSFKDLVTVGVLLTPRFDGARPWDTTLVRAGGDLELSDEELRRLGELWNVTSPGSRRSGSIQGGSGIEKQTQKLP